MLKTYYKPLVSIIIRTKDEERWLKALLFCLSEQTYQSFEIIIVDNNSQDKTIEICKKNGVKKITKISEYNPSLALNMGVDLAEGNICVFLSAHCVPASQTWLEELIKPICKGEVLHMVGKFQRRIVILIMQEIYL